MGLIWDPKNKGDPDILIGFHLIGPLTCEFKINESKIDTYISYTIYVNAARII